MPPVASPGKPQHRGDDTMSTTATFVYRHACKLGYEGIVSKRLGSPYVSCRSRHWLKSKNPALMKITAQSLLGRRSCLQSWQSRLRSLSVHCGGRLGDSSKPVPNIERAYISGGGGRRLAPGEMTGEDGKPLQVILDTGNFEFHISNYGKRPVKYSKSDMVSVRWGTFLVLNPPIRLNISIAGSIPAGRACQSL